MQADGNILSPAQPAPRRINDRITAVEILVPFPLHKLIYFKKKDNSIKLSCANVHTC